MASPKIAIIMGSTSDWPTMEHAAEVLDGASMTQLPVLGVPVQSAALSGFDSLLSIAQMPGGVPVGTLAIGKAGAKNAGLMAASILALSDSALAERLRKWRMAQTAAIGLDPKG